MKSPRILAQAEFIQAYNFAALMKSVLVLVVLLASTTTVFAHKPSDSFLNLERNADSWQLRWDIALRDLEFAIGLDIDQNRKLTRGEVNNQAHKIGAYALSRLQLTASGIVCDTSFDSFDIRKLDDGSYASLLVSANCPGSEAIELDYSLFFDLDPTHRGLVNVHDNGQNFSHVLSDTDHLLILDRGDWSAWATLYSFVREGVWHIWIGYDHILFLLTLLLPAVLFLKNGRWQSVNRLSDALVDTLKIVTAFTLAHSITLTLASLQILTLPPRFVESMIAFSVLVTAINNLLPIFRGSRWLVAFGFGLIHGFGFASVLQDLGLETNQLALSLLGFNLGVELGQLAIVAAFIPLAYLIRDSAFYRWGLLRAGSVMAAAVATVWLIERLFNYQLLEPLKSI
ncbi:MAG: HupE/UreJ family protein [Gammaproteobacteria bacterium]|nr:HupE/UreJ family protein [Gammaproteobacteria bacterium]